MRSNLAVKKTEKVGIPTQNRHSIRTQVTTRYKVHVTGTIFGEGNEQFNHTYDLNTRPSSKDEISKIAGDFDTIQDVTVEEIMTTVNKRVLNLR